MAVLDKNKLLGKKNGGALAVRPKTNIVPVKGKGSSIEKASSENPTLVIREKVIKIEDILKGTLAAEKKAADERRKVKEQEKRAKSEQGVESPDSKEKGIKLAVPGKIKSWWGNIKKFFGTVLFGWLALRLVDWLPKLMPLLKTLGSIAEWLLNAGGVILAGLVNFVDWGYKAVEATEKWIGDKFGPDAAAKFESFMAGLTRVMNVVVALGMAAASMVGGPGGGPKPKGPRRGLGNQLKRTRTKIKRFFDPKRADKLKRAKNIKEIAKQRRIAQNALKRQRFWRKIRPTNLKRTAQVVLGKTNQWLKGRPKPGPGLFGHIKAGAGQLWKGTTQVAGAGWDLTKKGASATWNFTTTQGKRFGNWANKAWVGFSKNLNNIIGGITDTAKGWAQEVGDIVEMAKNPAKLIEKVKGVLKGQIDDIVKNNKFISKILKFAKNPKELAKAMGQLLENAKKSKGLMQVKDALKGAQKMKIGGIDAVIAALMGLLDYTVFGESPINAILRALGGLLGYTAGFAIGAPFGGAPGFITGMAGAWVGEWASKMIAKQLAKTKLGEWNDPIMEERDIKAGREPRKLVRDPDALGVVTSDSKYITADGNSSSNNGVDAYPSYENGAEEQIYVIPSGRPAERTWPGLGGSTYPEKVVTVNISSGASADPYASAYRG